MKLENTEIVPGDVNRVYDLVKDALPSLVPYLPTISRIEVRQRETQQDGTTVVVSRWFAQNDIPAIARHFVSEDLLSWQEHSVWDDETKTARFKIESFVAKDLFEVIGSTTYRNAGDQKTEISTICEFNIYPERLPGIPKFLAARAKPLVDELVSKIVLPNLASLPKGLQSYFDEQ